jgi:lysophospholipase L1-like esterase
MTRAAGLMQGAALVAFALLCIGATARGEDPSPPCAPLADDPAAFAANDNHTGVIDLYFFGAQGATVTYYECRGEQAVQLGQRTATRDGYTPMYGATTWSCARRIRQFAATAVLAGGTLQRGLTDIRTPSCARRLRLAAPRRGALGRKVVIVVRDRWGTGALTSRWCVTRPSGRRACRVLRLAAAQRATRRAFVPDRRGRWRVSVALGRYRTSASVAIGVRAVPVRRRPRVLATGDSTMQGVDVALADELAGTADVISDVHPGAGLSYDGGWLAVAKRQATGRHATTIVLSIGADEGWPMTLRDGARHDCCDADWTAEYARRMRRVLATYRSHAHVIVLTVVAPRDPARAVIVTAARSAIVRAASGMRGVRLLRMDRLFTPDGYRDTIHYAGRDVAVREPDGVHLNVAGTAIEAREAAPAVRATLPRMPSPRP